MGGGDGDVVFGVFKLLLDLDLGFFLLHTSSTTSPIDVLLPEPLTPRLVVFTESFLVLLDFNVDDDDLVSRLFDLVEVVDICPPVE